MYAIGNIFETKVTLYKNLLDTCFNTPGHVGALKKLISEIYILFICRIITKKGKRKKNIYFEVLRKYFYKQKYLLFQNSGG